MILIKHRKHSKQTTAEGEKTTSHMANPIRMDKESLQALQGNNLSCPRDYSFLDKIDDAFVETNQLLNQAEDITGFGYISQKSRMHDIFMAYWELNTCIDTLLQEITEADNQLHRIVNDTANELERIRLEDIEIPDTIHYYNSYEELPTLTINNFIQDGFVETNASVQGFVDLFDGVIIYGEDEMTLEEYVQYLEAQSVCTISYYSAEKNNLNLLVTDLSMGVKDLYDGIAGYDIITGEHLSKQERTFKLWWGIGMMSFNLLMPAISGLRAQQAIGQKIYKWLDDIFLMEGVNPRILGGISQELAEQTARSGIQTISNKGLNTISRQITEEGVEDAIQITAREGVETIGEHVVQEGMEDTVQITTREGIEDTIQTATRDRIEAFGQRITPEGIPTGSHPWESIYSGVKENAAILEKQVIQQEIYIPNRYDSTYGIRATEQQFTREGVETTLETASREGIEEMQEQAMREAAEAMERGRVSSKSGTSTLSGQWQAVNESMSDFSRAYQKQITGQEGMAWVQNGIKFDGMKDGVLLDAKGKYSQFIDKNTEDFYEWFSGKESLIAEARRQIDASEGAKIQWYFAEEESLNVVQDLFIDKGITEIELIFEAPK